MGSRCSPIEAAMASKNKAIFEFLVASGAKVDSTLQEIMGM